MGPLPGSASATSRVREQLGLPVPGRIVLYAGRFAADHPVDIVLDLAPFVMDQLKVVHFVLIGDGPTRHRVEAEARKRNLDAALIFAGNVPADQIPLFAAACDIGLHLSQSVGSASKGFDVGDIFEFLKAGRPVVAASDTPDAPCFVQTHDIGTGCSLSGRRSADVATLVRAIGTILSDDRIRTRRGNNARQFGNSLRQTAVGGVLDVVRASLRRAASL